MSRKHKEDEPNVYIIPPNFIAEGTLFGGRLKTRNAVEASVFIALAIFLILNVTFVRMDVRIIIASILFAPPAVVALFGVNNGPLSEFVFDFIRFKLPKREIEYDTFASDTQNQNVRKDDGK